MQIFETTEKEKFNVFLISQDASILQSWQWGEFQKKLGRKVWRLLVTTDTDKLLGAVTVVKMPLPRNQSYFYCPRGPVVANAALTDKIWQLILDKLQDLVVVEKPVFLRVDPQLSEFTPDFDIVALGFQKIPWEVQPKDTLLLDLERTEEDILHAAKPKTRYNINLAQRKGVTVEKFTDGKRMKDFWELMRQTTDRDGFSAHPYLYYFNLLEALAKSGSVQLFLATYNRRPLAGLIVSYFGGTATYLHGASSDRFRSVMAPYLAQWAAITDAKARGMKYYDWWGVAPTDATEKHAWHGIGRFKRGFGGREISYVGAYDLVYNKTWYSLYRLARWINKIG